MRSQESKYPEATLSPLELLSDTAVTADDDEEEVIIIGGSQEKQVYYKGSNISKFKLIIRRALLEKLSTSVRVTRLPCDYNPSFVPHNIIRVIGSLLVVARKSKCARGAYNIEKYMFCVPGEKKRLARLENGERLAQTIPLFSLQCPFSLSRIILRHHHLLVLPQALTDKAIKSYKA